MWLHREISYLADIPRYWGKRTPDKTALIDSLGSISYMELDASCDRIASSLGAEDIAGVPLGFLGKNSSRYFELLFGAARAGCALTPLNWRLAGAELLTIIEDAKFPVIFVDDEFVDEVKALAVKASFSFRIISFDSTSLNKDEFDYWVEENGGLRSFPRIHPDDPAMLVYTSGTTGGAKGVVLTHRAFDAMRLCEHLSEAFEWRAGDVMLTVMPVFHMVGTGFSVQAMYNGAAVSILPALDVDRVLSVIERDRPSICVLVPTAIQMLIDHPDAASTDFSSLRLVMYAGSPITATLLRRAMNVIGCRFMQFYGATEVVGALTLLRPDQHDPNDEAKLRSCGRPLPLIEIRVVDENGQDVEANQPGELWVRGPTIFRNYWRRPEESSAAFRDGWYRTGDAGYRDCDGFLYLVDRVKDMIVTGGENVYSAEVEQVLARHPDVRFCAVIGLPDPKWGERVTAIVVQRPEGELTAEMVAEHCRKFLAGYKIPKSVYFTDSLPLTSTGKVLKREVRKKYQSLSLS